MTDLAAPNSHYTHRVVAAAVAAVAEDGLPYRAASLAPVARPPRLRPLGHDPELGRGGGGKKRPRHLVERYLDDALADFSGYLAIDELYDGPFCVLSVVDNRTFRRLAYRVLDHPPKAKDITSFLGLQASNWTGAAWRCAASPPTARPCTPARWRWSSTACRTRSAASTSSRS